MNSKHSNRPLEGVRVLEIGQLLAGPFTGTILGYFGAEVIKVEPPNKGDPIRGWREVFEGTSYWWASLARNKKCVTLDLSKEEGRKIFRQLADQSDVLVENFKPGTMEKWGVDPASLEKTNAKLIYARISGYGQTGPYAKKAGFASVCEAFGGFRYVNGFPGEKPVRPNLSIGDTLAGIHAAMGVLLALIQREKDGKGQIVDVAIFEAIFNLLEAVIPEYSGSGLIRQPSGSTITGIAPTNTYICQDGKYIVIGANTDSMFKRLAEAMGKPEIGLDQRMSDNGGRVAVQQELDDTIENWTKSLSAQEALAKLDEYSVAAGPIYDARDMMEDPQFKARNLFQNVTINGKEIQIPAIAPHLSRSPGQTEFAGSELGCHNEEIYQSVLGIEEEALHLLAEKGVI
jgi:crotonobetainyl-CoA:carnitine CoA-transferase CaiB-like acyl-CoA transferase